MSSDTVHHSRTIYSFWDFLGDVGGLFDMLKLIGSIIVAFLSIVSGSGMNRYIISSLFMTDDEEIPNSKTNNE